MGIRSNQIQQSKRGPHRGGNTLGFKQQRTGMTKKPIHGFSNELDHGQTMSYSYAGFIFPELEIRFHAMKVDHDMLDKSGLLQVLSPRMVVYCWCFFFHPWCSLLWKVGFLWVVPNKNEVLSPPRKRHAMAQHGNIYRNPQKKLRVETLGKPHICCPENMGGNLEFLITIPSVESIGMRSTARCYTTWLILNNWSKKSGRQLQWQSERWFQIIATCPSCVIPIRDILYNDITYIIKIS